MQPTREQPPSILERHGIRVTPVACDRRGIARFLRVPYGIYDGDPNWVAPLVMDLQLVFQPRNPLFDHAEMQLWVAERDGRDVGRIMGLEERSHNEVHGERTAFFGFYESVDDPGVAGLLFEAVRDWAKARGLTRLLGPTNPTTNDECGLVVDGFDSPPLFMMPYNPRYYVDQFESEGFTKAKDLLAFHIDIAGSPHDRLNRLAALCLKRNPGLRWRPVKKQTLKADLARIKEVYNAAWEDNWGFVPMTDAEIDFLAARLKPLLVPGLVCLMEHEGRPVAFMLAAPDFNEALQPLRGRLMSPALPRFLTYVFGWRSTRLCRVITLGAVKGWRGKGLEAVMLSEGFKVGFDLGFQAAEASWVLEDNVAMCRVIETMGGRVYKTYRLYERPV
ncbi:MAG: N-acetyltransferase [Verrucomicrobiales bacterium]|nr:N-acetyltransferase [Verrucomicrobiales bacterium]